MSVINVRRFRNALARAAVTDEANALELATSLDDELSESVATLEKLETLEDRIDARFREQDARIDARFREQDAKIEARFNEQDAKIEARFNEQDAKIEARFNEQDAKNDARFREQDARFAQADADSERRANRHTAIQLAAMALAVGVIAILIVVL